MTESAPSPTHYFVSVRDLVDWCFRTGNLSGNSHFQGPQRAIKGIRGHQQIQDSRPSEYLKEVPLQCTLSALTGQYTWTLRGRADGVWPQNHLTVIEEIKTVTPRWNGQPSDLHWAQSKIYAAILARRDQLDAVDTQLTYLEIESGMISIFRESWDASQLEEFFLHATHTYTQVLDARWAWHQELQKAVDRMEFPFPSCRPGQMAIRKAVESTLRNGGTHFIQAPTGLGKTMAILHPAMDYAARHPDTVVFYLTARNSNKKNAEKAAAAIRAHGGEVRSVTLGASHDWCQGDISPCDVQSCGMAVGYYDRSRKAILDGIASSDHWDQAFAKSHGQAHQICPSALSHELSDWANLIIADYNCALDPKAALKKFFFDENDRRIVLLIDEAHNLPDRARHMFGSTLNRQSLEEVKSAIPRTQSRISAAIQDVLTLWPALNTNAPECLLTELSGPFADALTRFKEISERWLILNESSSFRAPLLDAYFQTFDFLHASQNRSPGDCLIQYPTRLEILCLDPGPKLEKIFQKIHAVVFFSATLVPEDYYIMWLSPTRSCDRLEVPSPYPQENLSVYIETGIRTQWQSRQSTAGKLCRLIHRFINRIPGNHLIFFPSFEYLELIGGMLLLDATPEVEIFCQKRQSSVQDQADFLNLLCADPPSSKRLVSLAVLGGVFAEGIDLPPQTISGITVVGVGMPQIGLERNLIRDHLTPHLGTEEAFAYAYIYPGLTKVVQAVGRLIRSESDTGSVMLIDPRLSLPQYQKLLPPWWKPQYFQFKSS